MSYMNDDCDPFGVPYPNDTNINGEDSVENQIVEYDLKEYRGLIDKKIEFKEVLKHLEDDINDAEIQLSRKIKRICDGYIRDIEFGRNQVIVFIQKISLLSLLKLKDNLELKDIEIECENGYFKLLYLDW